MAPDLGGALRFAVRNRKALSHALELELVVDPPPRLGLGHPMDALDDGCGAEVGLGIGVRLLRETMGMTDALASVHLLRHTRFALEHYQAFYQVPVHFDRPSSALVFRDDALGLPNPMADPALLEHLRRHRDGAQQRLSARDHSPLRRALRAEGTSPRQLLEHAREAHARQLLGDPLLSVDQVAALVGYASERSFRRAFERWTGRSPAALRRDTSP